MDFKKVSEDLLSFVQQSPTAFHAVNNIAERLKQDGFVQLLEGDHWDIEKGKKSMAITITFLDENKTLKDEEVNLIMKKITDTLLMRFNAEVRS